VETITITTQNHETYSAVSNFFIDYYMTDANGEFVKVYLYLVRLLNSGRAVTVADIADHFNLTEKDICRAIRYWIKEGVLQLEYTKDKVLTGITMLPLTAKAPVIGNSSLLSMLEMEETEVAITEEPKQIQDNTKNASSINETLSKATTDTTDQTNIGSKRTIPERITYKPSYVASKEESDEDFVSLRFQMQTYYNRPLTTTDVNTLLYIYEDLSFTPDLIEYLFEHCLEIGKMNSRYIQAVAVNWYQEGIMQVEQAKANASSYNAKYNSVLKHLGITGRTPTANEKKLIDSWYNTYAFDQNIITEACDRAIASKPHSANLQYVNGILDSWFKQNVKTLSDVHALDEKWVNEKKKKTTSGKSNTNQFNNYQSSTTKEVAEEFESLFLQETNE